MASCPENGADPRNLQFFMQCSIDSDKILDPVPGGNAQVMVSHNGELCWLKLGEK